MSNRLITKVDEGTGQRTLVLLHGLGNNHESWTHVLEAINKDNCRVIVPDLLGFGDSPKPEILYSPEDHANAVIDLLDAMGVRDVILAGHSMGCIVAIQVAKMRPDIAKHLVLLGAPLYRTMPKQGFFAKLRHAESMYFTIFSFIKKNPNITIASASAADKLLPLLKGMQITEETWPAFTASLNNTIMQLQSYKDMLALTTPTMLIYGKLDFFVIKRNLKNIARKNKKYVKFKTVLGPHEITPQQGELIAEILQEV